MSIVTTIKGGSEAAFTRLYSQYHAKLYHYYLNKTKSGNNAAELVQLTFIKLWKFRNSLNEDISIDSQIFTIARTCMIDFIRRQAQLKKSNSALEQHYHLNSYFAKPDPAFETTDYFNQATRSMPPVRKKVFALNRVQGFSYKEIAQHLSLSVKTVEDHMAKAMKHIRTLRSFF